MKALIIEDETRAASRLAKLIADADATMEVVAVLESVREGVAFLDKSPPVDVIFSDIQLADGLSFEIYEKMESLPPIIFTTAYDQYALKAFKANGIDYLLKPIDAEALAGALEKLKRMAGPTIDIALLQTLSEQLKTGSQTGKERFMVKVGNQLKSVATKYIQAFYSLEKSTFILTDKGRSYPLDYSLDQIETMVSTNRFFRISRGYIVSIEACTDITAWTNSRLKINLPGLENELIIVARNRVKDFKTWLGEA